MKTKGMIYKYKGNENLAKGKRIDKGNRKMLLIGQREWNKQKGNDEKAEKERENSAYN